ncbi:MAG: DUF4340 domain-containing protein [Akkermansia sp.]|nr:DUF4340 domain-containing protein [Akkermansia sp.]
MRILPTILLSILAAGAVTMATFLAIDGNLARITGWYRFEPGMPLFSEENLSELDDVCWMRIQDLHDEIVCAKDEHGAWWIIKPFKDRLAPSVAEAIFSFTANARLVDTLPLNNVTRSNMREFGVETAPHRITLKRPDGPKSLTTVARYTLGSTSPWLADAGDGETLFPTTYLRTNFYGRDKRIHVVSGNILHIFKDGLEALRDASPLQFNQDELRRISIITEDGSVPEMKLQRISAEAPWSIVSPVITGADEDNVNKLIRNLLNLKAVRVEDSIELELSEKPLYTIRLEGEWGEQPRELRIFNTFTQEGDDQKYCYATVNDRPVIFTLQAEPRSSHTGSYARLINAICELPVLPQKALAQVRMANKRVAVSEMPKTLPELRSMKFADIDTKDVARFSLRTTRGNGGVRFLMIPGDTESKVDDAWMFAVAGKGYEKAESTQVTRFLNGLGNIPVEKVVADAAPGENMAPLLEQYGLNDPDYILSVLPRPCMVRATIFGQDLPMVKDRLPRTFMLRRFADPTTGRRAWFGSEIGSNSICMLSTKFTRMLSLRAEKWKDRNLLDFPISAVRRLTLDFQQAPLVLDYEYMGETWSGTLKGEDITPRINPHRAAFYLRQLQKLKVSQWLDAADEEALAALQNPAFAVKLELEMTDYSDAEDAVVEQAEDTTVTSPADSEAMLQEAGEDADILRSLATMERKTHSVVRTIQIAPAAYDSDRPFFYGRVQETGQLFILPYEDAQSLAGDFLDM